MLQFNTDFIEQMSSKGRQAGETIRVQNQRSQQALKERAGIQNTNQQPQANDQQKESALIRNQVLWALRVNDR